MAASSAPSGASQTAPASQVAADFYYLTSNGTQSPDTSVVARALHQATRNLRARFPDLPTA
jgi:hypothetical protein